MADEKISGVPAVVTPAATDQYATNQSGVSKSTTRAQTQTLVGSEKFTGDAAKAPALVNESASLNNPTLLPNKADVSAGIGQHSPRALSLIAGSVEVLRLYENLTGSPSSSQVKWEINASLTAFAGGGIGNGFLTASYNIVTTVATDGDSISLPTDYDAGTLIHVKNDGANSLDLFPGAGDDLGNGVGIAEAIAAGESRTFIATVDSSAWTQLIVDTTNVVSGGLLTAEYRFDTSIVSADPGSGRFRYNNATPASVTEIFIDDFSNAGIDISNLLGLITTGDRIYLQTEDDGSEFLVLNVTAPITDNTGWFTITGTVEASGTLHGNNDACLVALQIGGAGAAGDVVKVGTPANNELAVWTGDGTLEGDPNFDIIGTLLQGNNASGPGLVNEAAGFGNPTLLPDKGQLDVGIGSCGAMCLTIVVGGAAGQIWREISGGSVLVSSQADTIAASITQTQGNGQLVGSYNRITPVANDNDVVTLPGLGAFGLGTHLLVVNDGANILQVFPQSGDDLGEGLNASTTIAAGESLLFFGLGTVFWQQVANSAALTSVPDPLLLGDGSAAAPSYSFSGDTDQGMFRLGGNLGFTTAGTLRWVINNTELTTGLFGGPLFRGAVVASATVPTIMPNSSDINTGLGWFGADALSLVAGGAEIARAVNAAIDQFLVATGTVAAPGLAFLGDEDTGIVREDTDRLGLVAGGVAAALYQEGFGTGVLAGSQNDIGLVASVTQTQAGGLVLRSSYNEVATVATTGDALTLQGDPRLGGVAGKHTVVVNNGANDLQLFPALGDAIGGGAVNASVTVVPGGVIILLGRDSANWDILYNGPATPLGKVVQTSITEDSAVATGTGVIPVDDTIPQITEGSEYMTVVHTPLDAANLLNITIGVYLENPSGSRMSVALFQDAVANALAAINQRGDTGDPHWMYFRTQVVAGGTSAITFRVRAGSETAGTTTFNGRGGVRVFGGVMASNIYIEEVTP